ncbi:uncharacterized protein LOC142167461 [Nicotiana tabacum]|uniref:Uncharacterized protein LOC142167461 n=1 Tax=Nicotiana tabacum TaxID=4097 RepID=A0AC58SFF9_TOBAC
MRALLVKNKLGFINGNDKKPDPNSSSYRLWERCNDMVTSWILNLLEKEIANSVEYVTDAMELWKELEDQYDKTNGTKLYQIQKEINDLSQGALDITSYYTKMKKLWDELTTLITKSHCTCNCTCGARESMHKAEHDRRLIQFLMGLNETYTVVRGSILMMNPLPIIAQAFSLLIQEERQREIKPHNHLSLESSALNVNTNRTTSFKTNYSPNNSQCYRNRPFCDYCKRPGHTREKCYKLHGYPQGSNQNQNPNISHNQASSFNQNPRQNYNYGNNSGVNQGTRFNRGNRRVANAHVAAADTQHTGDKSCSAQNFSLTKEEYNQLAPSMKRPLVIGRVKYGLYILCPRTTWADLLSIKSNAYQVLKGFFSLVENQFGVNVKAVRIDNGLEFTNTETNMLFQSKGIIHQRAYPYTPQQNGVVERKHKYLLETARALLFQSKLPQKYWDECILCATFLINRLPSTSINDQTPYELLYKRKPNYSHLKSFGCMCYPTVPRPHRDKFEPRTTPHLFVGYPFNTMGYKVLSLATRKIIVSRDVVFNKSIFPFATNLDISSQFYVPHSIPFIEPLCEKLPDSTNDHTEQSHEEPIQLRQSSRTHKAPSYLQDYVHSLPKLKPNTNSLSALFFVNYHVASDLLTPNSQVLVRNVCHDKEPSLYEEATIDPAWQAAMTQEFEALYSNHTWYLVALPPGKQAI